MQIPDLTWIIGSVIGFAVAWGSIRSTVSSLQRQMEDMTVQFHEMRNLLAELKTSVVRLQAIFDTAREYRKGDGL